MCCACGIRLGALPQDSQQRTVEIISNHHAQIVAFAQKSYDLDGGGVIQLDFPNVPPGMTVVGIRMMKYVQLAEIRRLASPGDEDAAILLRMVETYDPSRQAVVLAAIDGENPISMKLKLEMPNVVADQRGVR